MPLCQTYTTYERVEQLMQAYAEERAPDLKFRAKHVALWLLAWSAALPRGKEARLPGVDFEYDDTDDYLATLSAWRHLTVDAAALLRAIAEEVHGRQEPMPREKWEPMLRTTEALFISMGAPRATWALREPPAPMRCLHDARVQLALAAPDVRKAALELSYRCERRCHEHCAPGGEAALVQRSRMAHTLSADRHVLLHAELDDMPADAQELILVAHVHCVLMGQQRLDFARRVVHFEAELSSNALHARAVPVLARRRAGWAVLWQGQSSDPSDARFALNSWRALVVQSQLNPIDGRHDVATV